MAKIKNIIELREHSVELLEDLKKGRIDVVEAGVSAKICEGIVSALKIELEYHKLLDQKPTIKFLEGSKVPLTNNKKLIG